MQILVEPRTPVLLQRQSKRQAPCLGLQLASNRNRTMLRLAQKQLHTRWIWPPQQWNMDLGEAPHREGVQPLQMNLCGRRCEPSRRMESGLHRLFFTLPKGRIVFRVDCAQARGLGTAVQSPTEASSEQGDIVDRQLVVVGGGAAGIFAALRAKQVSPQLKVLVLEKGQPLSKVKISGGGRCNVTTGLFVDPLPLSEQYPRGHKELRGSFFRTHGPRETAAWFAEHGVPLKIEEDGRMFPVSNSSATIVDCLLTEAQRLGVCLQTSRSVTAVHLRNSKRFSLETGSLLQRKETILADFVLLATGSSPQGYRLAKQLGHSIVDPVPSLFTFKIEDPALHELAGVSFSQVKAELQVTGIEHSSPKWTQAGPLLITHWGLSGPVVLRLSAWAARQLFSSDYEGILWVDFMPHLNSESALDSFFEHKESFMKRKVGSLAPASLEAVRRAWLYLLKKQGIDADMLWAAVPKKSIAQLVSMIKKCPFHISAKGQFKDEFVKAGGVPLTEVNLKTMESKTCEGLFLAGEILNVDGLTGGFNFQNAWTGGFIAGSTIGQLAALKTNC